MLTVTKDGNMDIAKGEVFLKILELGSLTKAADALGYTQAGISHILSSIEDDWNLTLLLRDRSGIRLTSDGLKLLPLIRAVCLANRALEKEVDEILGLHSGLIRIGAFHSVAVHWLPKIIKAFGTEYPQINFDIVHGTYIELEEWVRDGLVDAAFLRLPTGGALETIFLGEDRLVAVLPEQHPLAGSERFPVEKIPGDPFVMMEDADHEVADYFQRIQVKPDVRFVVKDHSAIISMVESGLGISLLPELLLRNTPYHIVIKELSVPAYRRIGIAVRDSPPASPAVRRFLEYARQSSNGSCPANETFTTHQ
jgi:DNA-binding transcriptional LysR family regulator